MTKKPVARKKTKTWPAATRSAAEKMRRFRALEDSQAKVAASVNARDHGQTVEVLVEESHKGKAKGGMRTNQLVFFLDDAHAEWKGRPARRVTITQTISWSLQGEVVQS